jgi:hypothetical protein
MSKKQPNNIEMSEEILMLFIERIEASVSKVELSVKEIENGVGSIRDSIARQKTKQGILETNLNNHIQNEETSRDVKSNFDKKLTVALTVIGILISIMFYGIGYHSKTVKEFNEFKTENVK